LLLTQRLAAGALGKVLAGRNLSHTLNAIWTGHPELTGQQRAAVQDLSYGTLRWYGQLNAALESLLAQPLQDQTLRCLLLVGLYQLQYSKAPAHAVVDHAVKTAEALGKGRAKGLVNAVLRNFLRKQESLLEEIRSDEVARYSHPRWWIDKLKVQYPQHWEAILDAGNRHPPMTLRVNRRLASVEGYLDMLQSDGLEGRISGASAITLEQPVSVERLPGFRDGLVSVQDAGAQHAAALLDVEDGMRVLDACAAPGGKTAHLLESADLDLTALDNDAARLHKVGQNLQRLNLRAHLVLGDAGRPEAWWDGQPFQRILADVPCSASGVVRRHPDIKWLRRESDIAQFAAQQADILAALWRCLARGGKLLYVTCSIFNEENQLQIASFLNRHPDAQRLPLPGLDSADGQLIPDDNHDGFYYALLSKT
jgi:16S rRNA (cytosine967-C5)-methyltransferase